MARRTERGRVGKGGQFTAPAPKGVRLAAPIPKSMAYEAPEPDPDEEAAFTSAQPGKPGARTGQGTHRRRGDMGALTPAQLRMQAARTGGNDEDDDDTEDEQDGNLDFDGAEEIDPPAPVRPPAPAPSASHPISPFGGATPATAAQGNPQHLASDSVEGLYCRPVGLEDTDRLWDWIRSDKDYGQAFLGRRFGTSLLLHQFMQSITNAEAQQLALIRAIQYHEHHLGFLMLAPILAQERTALLHVYLQPVVRTQFGQFIAPLVEIAHKAAPHVHLAVASDSDASARVHRQVLKPLGFVEHTMFIL